MEMFKIYFEGNNNLSLNNYDEVMTKEIWLSKKDKPPGFVFFDRYWWYKIESWKWNYRRNGNCEKHFIIDLEFQIDWIIRRDIGPIPSKSFLRDTLHMDIEWKFSFFVVYA